MNSPFFEPLPDRSKVTNVVQGSCVASNSQFEVYSTTLGSCVCTCLSDPVARVGGMNHFLLPSAGRDDSRHLRYGSNAMELLINALLKLGADRDRLEAKLFGGAAMTPQLGAIGKANADFAQEYLAQEGIRCTAQSLGGVVARRIRFWPATGRVQQMFLTQHDAIPVERPRFRARGGAGEVTFFRGERYSNSASPKRGQ
ncbi:chemotaxis protein CheD [Rhodobacter sp. NSM]|uniref:chemotaxis protein CheD n=1 Tax=Rhodobacter sp. NSM TaxID=3457501 RepID=UPI003FD3A8DF